MEVAVKIPLFLMEVTAKVPFFYTKFLFFSCKDAFFGICIIADKKERIKKDAIPGNAYVLGMFNKRTPINTFPFLCFSALEWFFKDAG